jgi:tight adherence protein B
LQEVINQSGIEKVTVSGLIASCAGTAIFTFLLILVITQSPPIARSLADGCPWCWFAGGQSAVSRRCAKFGRT